jgi:hypothetical protein
MPTLTEPKVIVSAAIEAEQRDELARRARVAERTLSQQIRLALREHLESGRAEGDGAPRASDQEGEA